MSLTTLHDAGDPIEALRNLVDAVVELETGIQATRKTLDEQRGAMPADLWSRLELHVTSLDALALVLSLEVRWMDAVITRGET